EAQCLSGGPGQLRPAEQDHGRVLHRAVPGPRRGAGHRPAQGHAGGDGLHRRAGLNPDPGMHTAAPADPAGEARPVTALRGVGEALAEKLARLGITTVQDLLFLLPLRYEDRTSITPLGALSIGERAVVEGEVQLTEVTFRGRRQMLCRIGDGSGWLTLRFFYFSNSQQTALARGVRVRCYGEIRR